MKIFGPVVWVALAALLISSPSAVAQDLKRPEEQLAAIYALRVQLEIEQRRMDDALQRYNEVARLREETRARVARLYDDLDAMVQGRADADAGQIQDREDEIMRAEETVTSQTQESRRIRADIKDAHTRIELLGERIGRMRKTLPSDNESLTGSWDISYLPSGDKGIFSLRQSGTLLSGEYTLEGGWKGSLQGTFVDGKLLLHRIDSKLGRSSDLEGTLAPDGRTIRGTWQNFILSGGQPTNGQWIARKRQEKSDD